PSAYLEYDGTRYASAVPGTLGLPVSPADSLHRQAAARARQHLPATATAPATGPPAAEPGGGGGGPRHGALAPLSDLGWVSGSSPSRETQDEPGRQERETTEAEPPGQGQAGAGREAAAAPWMGVLDAGQRRVLLGRKGMPLMPVPVAGREPAGGGWGDPLGAVAVAAGKTGQPFRGAGREDPVRDGAGLREVLWAAPGLAGPRGAAGRVVLAEEPGGLEGDLAVLELAADLAGRKIDVVLAGGRIENFGPREATSYRTLTVVRHPGGGWLATENAPGLRGAGSSAEGEFPYPMAHSDGRAHDELRGRPIAMTPDGAKVVLEKALYFLGPGGRYYQDRQKAKDAGGSGDVVGVMIPEVIPAVAANEPAELSHRPEPDAAFGIYQATEQALADIRGQPGDAPHVPIEKVLTKELGWTLTEEAKGWKIGPRPIGAPLGAQVHHNIGVPLAVVHPFLRQVLEHTRQDQSLGYFPRDHHLADALKFADDIAARFIARRFLGHVPSDLRPVYRLLDIPDLAVQELRGHAAALYVTGAMLVTGQFIAGLDKVHAAALVRRDPDKLLASLPESARDYLGAEATVFLRMLGERLYARVPDLDDRYRQRNRLPADHVVRALRWAPQKEEHTIGSFLASGLVTGYPRITRLRDVTTINVFEPDEGGSVPKEVVEVRTNEHRYDDAATTQQEQATLVGQANNLLPLAWRLHNSTDEDRAEVARAVMDLVGAYDVIQGGRSAADRMLGRWREYGLVHGDDQAVQDWVAQVAGVGNQEVLLVRQQAHRRRAVSLMEVLAHVYQGAPEPRDAGDLADRLRSLRRLLDAVRERRLGGLRVAGVDWRSASAPTEQVIVALEVLARMRFGRAPGTYVSAADLRRLVRLTQQAKQTGQSVQLEDLRAPPEQPSVSGASPAAEQAGAAEGQAFGPGRIDPGSAVPRLHDLSFTVGPDLETVIRLGAKTADEWMDAAGEMTPGQEQTLRQWLDAVLAAVPVANRVKAWAFDDSSFEDPEVTWLERSVRDLLPGPAWRVAAAALETAV
ncbi:MAG: hypothetical protein ABSA93_40940, partial [Streptosporangiaceae bacterium]